MSSPPAAIPAAEGLSKLGHELRGPLTGIIGLTRVLLAKLNAGPADPAQQTRQLEMILTTARRSLTTIERVVDLTRIESGRLECDPLPIDCRTVTGEVTAAFQAAAGEHGLGLHTDFPARPVLVTTDAGILARVLRELIDNAVKFAGSGDIVVRIHGGGNRPVEIDVSDHGPGVPADEQSRIFAAFERGDLAAGRDDDGAGLGLFMAGKLAELLAARLSVDSLPGQPTTFTVTFSDPGVRPESEHGTHSRSRI